VPATVFRLDRQPRHPRIRGRYRRFVAFLLRQHQSVLRVLELHADLGAFDHLALVERAARDDVLLAVGLIERPRGQSQADVVFVLRVFLPFADVDGYRQAGVRNRGECLDLGGADDGAAIATLRLVGGRFTDGRELDDVEQAPPCFQAPRQPSIRRLSFGRYSLPSFSLDSP
jgi:hypothetical protein